MSHRPLPTQAVHRDYMEKFNGSFRNRFWFVISVSFFLWFLMFYLHSRALSGPRNNIQSIPKEYANLVLRDMETQKPNHQLPEPNEVNTQPHVDHQLPVSQEMNKHLPVNPLPALRNIDTPPSIDQLPVSQEVDTQLRLNQLPELSDVDTPSERVDPLPVLVELETQTPFNQLPVSQDVDTQPHVDHRLPVSQEVDAQLPINQSPIIQKRPMQNKDPCSGHYVYVHKLPSRFNEDMLKECKKLSLWTDMCRFTSNAGLGPTLDRSEHVFSTRGWFATNQFALDVIFNNRMKQYKCLTNDSTKASAVFVPFYAGLDISRYLWGSNTSVRDSASLDIIKWLTAQPEWRAMWGRDHFLVAGRITWDFRRTTDKESDWGNKLIILPEAKNMTILVIESSPWSSNDFGIPYPTYFHPSNDHQIIQWQNRMRRIKRRWLFSFAGGPRKNISGLIRGAIVDQCRASSRGKLLECNTGPSKCHSPSSLMKMFQSSVFCLQPQGDSFTRRSTFDSMLAGCIPVFFHPGSAYVQYVWHLPRNYKKYSVFIPAGDVSEGKASIEKILLEIPASKVRAMRKNVIEMIPRLIYADPRSRLERFEDAFDVAVKGVIEKVNRSRKEMRDGIRNVGFDEKKNWKYDLIGRDGPHEWDPFFSKPKDSDTEKRK